ncbi:MAG: hypothetical protein A3A22_03815 [Candidatus Taylorbacteria bacterium RIFCSPLOWO2_01_FULL_45_34b]|nr:MAG: hypothetical protein A3A22_03815 [Candidatus Taylorbacteria bacterium RIFCSPLOWO2_01_FULL_45_34b]
MSIESFVASATKPSFSVLCKKLQTIQFHFLLLTPRYLVESVHALAAHSLFFCLIFSQEI